MRQTRTQVTEELFNRVRHYQLVKTYPMEAIRRETGLGADSIRKIRRFKTWDKWVNHKQSLVAKRKGQPVPTVNKKLDLRFMDADIQAAFGITIAAEQAYATRADLTKVASAQITDAGKLWDAVEKLQKDNAKLADRVTKQYGRHRATNMDLKNIDRELRNAQLELEDIRAFQDKVNASPFKRFLLRKSVKRVKASK